MRDSLLLLDATEPDTVKAVQVGSQQWYEWLASHPGFQFEGGTGHFTARRELRRGIEYWYAYRRYAGKLSKTYLGKSEELTLERLEQASARDPRFSVSASDCELPDPYELLDIA